jgi:hypothetical protein
MIQPGAMVIDPSGTHLYLYLTGANDAFPGVSGNRCLHNLSSTGVLSPVKGMPLPIGSKFLYLQDTSNPLTGLQLNRPLQMIIAPHVHLFALHEERREHR